MHNRPLLLTLILGVLVVSNVRAEKIEKPKIKAQTQVAKEVMLFDIFQFPTLVRPMQITTIPSEIQGEVTELKVHLGEAVKRGQELLYIKNSDPVFRYQKAAVRAPFDGVISAVHIVEGSLVNNSSPLIEVTNPSKIKLTIEIPANELPFLMKNPQGELHFNNKSSHNMNGKGPLKVTLQGTSPNINPATGTATGELLIDQGQELPPSGLLGSVTFKSNMRQAISLPESSTFYDIKKTKIGLLENNKYKSVEVELGVKSQGQVEVIKGIKEGDQVVTKLSTFANEGDDVVVENP